MSARTVSLLGCELEESLDQNGFRHRASNIGQLLGAERIGAGVYVAHQGIPIWPYHYHYGTEEWLYVIEGAPILRDPGGRRELGAGDLVCFPLGHRGAHTLEGPGRFVIFSADREPPYMSVYPDSDKLSATPVRRGGPPFDRIMVPRDAGVDYWYGEGDDGRRERVRVAREPDLAPSPHVANVMQAEGEFGEELDAEFLQARVLEIPAGGSAGRYRYEYGREEWVLVLRGRLIVRRPSRTEALLAGEAVCFREGPEGARELIASAEEPVRLLLIATTGFPVNACFPDAGIWRLRNGPGNELVLPAGDKVSPDQG